MIRNRFNTHVVNDADARFLARLLAQNTAQDHQQGEAPNAP
jgi:hypothetical protein